MIVSAIVAFAKNQDSGKNNQIPWHLPADLQYFKKTTLYHHILMGRNTYESIGRPLPKRTNIVLSRNLFFIASGCVVVHSLQEGLELAAGNGEKEVFIIGGGHLYQESMPILDRIYATEVDLETEGDTYFPEIDPEKWKVISEKAHKSDGKNKYAYTFKIYERI